jgi:hypothetical protein
MNSPIIIQGASANTNLRVSTIDFINNLKYDLCDADYYILSPPSGRFIAAALDWTIVVGTIGSIITIASAL